MVGLYELDLSKNVSKYNYKRKMTVPFSKI